VGKHALKLNLEADTSTILYVYLYYTKYMYLAYICAQFLQIVCWHSIEAGAQFNAI